MKLISMVKFINEIGNSPLHESYEKDLAKIYNYCTFLEQQLKLEMFIPCDEDGNVLEDPKGTDLNSSFFEMQVDYNLEQKYQQAKEKVFFEGFEVCNRTTKIDCVVYNEDHITLKDKTIEYLINKNLILTPNAIERIFR